MTNHKLNVCYKTKKDGSKNPRLWIEGANLKAAKWSKGDKFNVECISSVSDGTLQTVTYWLTKDKRGDKTVSGRGKAGNVTPIIDIVGRSIKWIDQAEYLDIDYATDQITVKAISQCPIDSKQWEQYFT